VTRKQDKVKNTVREWSKYGNITFLFAQEGSPQIRITFDPNGGSWSFVGKDNLSIPASKATMNLGWLDGGSDTITDVERGVILHEFGHVVGLLHEHQSPLRGNRITLKEDGLYLVYLVPPRPHLAFFFEAVIDFYTSSQKWSKEKVISQVIRVFNTTEISNFSEVDLKSIMMFVLIALIPHFHS